MVVVDASVAGKASALVLHNKDYQTLPEVTGSVTTKEGTTVIGSTNRFSLNLDSAKHIRKLLLQKVVVRVLLTTL